MWYIIRLPSIQLFKHCMSMQYAQVALSQHHFYRELNDYNYYTRSLVDYSENDCTRNKRHNNYYNMLAYKFVT